ncbi:sensor histidine kinase [Clostridium sp. LP20]|uniref:sensor histidine kinase n=1 Tax=Clostridium sp. LP20 TaxID=3418665 RepID=UPI003EE4D5E3
MPRVFYRYKVATIESKINTLTNDLSSNSYENPYEILDKFSYDNNLIMFIVDEDGRRIYSSVREGFNHSDRGVLPGLSKKKTSIMRKEEEFYFKQINKNCIVYLDIPIKAIDETETTIKIFFPFAILAIVVIALTISYFYSMIISKPLIEITKKAKKMSNLNFTEKFYPKGNDEIAQLSKSLNIMSENLYAGIKNLESANFKLQQDIDNERKIEKERKEFIQTISHELKSPITVLRGQLEGMIHSIGKYNDRDKYLKESYEVIKKMEQLVLELLDLSKFDNLDFQLNLERVDVSKLIREILRDNYYFIEQKMIKLDENIEKEVFVVGDKKLLNKVFSNIIGNAIQHSPINERIVVGLNSSVFRVKNSGVEIEEDDLINIFKAFYRVDKSRNSNTGGTGLGLYIVKSILDKHSNLDFSIVSKNNSVIFNINIEN